MARAEPADIAVDYADLVSSHDEYARAPGRRSVLDVVENVAACDIDLFGGDAIW